MRTLNVVLTHLRAEQVHERMELLRLVAGDGRFVVCYGGKRSEFERIDCNDKLFVDDPTLRGAEQHLQSWTRIFEAAWHSYFEDNPELDSLYLFEYDHLVLDAAFERRLRQLAAATGADFLGKNCVDRTATNWEHYVRFRRDERLLAHLRRVSVRENPERLFGCLGNGMWLSRRALESYVALGGHPPCYCETYVPTLLHHLGLRVVDIDGHSDIYRHVRWMPAFSIAEVLELAAAGAAFVHPVKDPAVDAALRPVILASGTAAAAGAASR